MNKIYNVGIFAHVDAGKTSVTEQMMLSCGAVRCAGNVDDGTAQSDWLDVERRRGISVKSACVRLNVAQSYINLVDTPGHVDFAGEVERCIVALDGAVLVVSAVEGVQSHTQIIWRELKRLEIPTVFLINKIDRVGSDTQNVVEQIQQELTPNVFPIHSVVSQGDESCRISSVINEKSDNQKDSLLNYLADTCPEIEEKFLNDEDVPYGELFEIFTKRCKSAKAFPLLFSSAKLGIGIENLVKAIIDFLPDCRCSKTDDLEGIVFKVEHDPVLGKAAHIRLFGGALKNRDTLPVFGRENAPQEKITQIRRVSGKKFSDLGELCSGDIGAIYGISNIKTGDTIGYKNLHRSSSIAVPLLIVKASPYEKSEKAKLMLALRELSDEDPLLDFSFSNETGEMYVKITGTIQLEILTELLRERYNLRAEFSKPGVIYKETPLLEGVGLERYTMPKPCWAVVELLIEPLPLGSGIKYKSIIKEKQLPYRYQHHVQTSVMQTLTQGIHGWEVTDAQITLVGGEHHNIHTHPLDFFVATPVAFLRALKNCGSTLLEPLLKVRLCASENLLGKVMGHIIEMRGQSESPVIKNGQFIMEAILPVATSLDYPITFRSMSSGKGTYFSEFYGYSKCPLELGAELPRKGVDPLDRSKWILYARSALQ